MYSMTMLWRTNVAEGNATTCELDDGELMRVCGGAVDPNELVQRVPRESYLSSTQDLRQHAERVKYLNEQKRALRDATASLRSQVSRDG